MTITEHLTDLRPTDGQIAEFERLIQGTLPEDYKSFLKSENGGRPKPNVFRFKVRDGREEDSVLHYFYALYGGRIGSIERTFARLKQRIPFGYLPIATDAFGNMILLKVIIPNSGRVYFWDHEKEESIPTVKNIFPIATSFAELVECLEMG